MANGITGFRFNGLGAGTGIVTLSSAPKKLPT